MDYGQRLAELDKRWEGIQEERFQLKEYGHLSFFEQAQMTGEERVWYMKRLHKEAEEKRKAEQNVPRPNMPSK